MKAVNARLLPRLSEGCNFCALFYTNPHLSEPFGAIPEIIGFDLFSNSEGNRYELVWPDLIYHRGPAACQDSGISFGRMKSGISQETAAKLLSAYMPLVVRTPLEQAIVLWLLNRFGYFDSVVVSAPTLALLAGAETPKFNSSLDMRRFFNEVAVSYF